MEPAIIVRGLGKSYRIRAGKVRYRTLRDTLADGMRRLVGRSDPDRPAEYRTFEALRDINFTVARGEVVGIIGANGAGKSTLLKLLARITPPSAGTVEMWGRVGALLEVGTGFHPELTGLENIYLSGTILGMTRREIDRHLTAIVDFAGIAAFTNVPVKRYSSGMRVRLGFAVAAFLQPEILLVDEVLAVGDLEFQQKCLDKIDEVARTGRTVIFVSHQLDTVARICTRTILLSKGRVIADGPTPAVLAQYKAGIARAADAALPSDSALRSLRVHHELNPDLATNMVIELQVNTHLRPLQRPVIGFDLKNEQHVVLVQLNNLHGEQYRTEPFGAGRIQLRIDGLYLLPGLYFLSLYIGDMHGDREKLIDIRTLTVDYPSNGTIDRTTNLFRPQNVRWHFESR